GFAAADQRRQLALQHRGDLRRRRHRTLRQRRVHRHQPVRLYAGPTRTIPGVGRVALSGEMIQLTRSGLSAGGGISSMPAIVTGAPVASTRSVIPADTTPVSICPTAKVSPRRRRSNTSSTTNLTDTVPPFESCSEPLKGRAFNGIRLILQTAKAHRVDDLPGPDL